MPVTALEKATAERNKGELGLNNISNRVQTHAKTPLNQQQLEFFLEEVDKSWQVIDDAHVKVVSLDAENAGLHERKWDDLFTLYTNSKCALKSMLATMVPISTRQLSVGSHSEIKLPKINLPTFAGEIHNWISFRDMYLTAIHNNQELSDAQKFTYLKSSLTGNAVNLIKSLTISDANYTIAWDTVTKRFENNRELYFAIMRRFCSLPMIPTSNSNALRSIVDAAMECTRALDTLPIANKWDAVLVFLLTQKLDPSSKEQWELSLKNTEIPKSSDLLEFIEQRARSLAASSSGRNPHVTRNPVTLHTRTGASSSDGKCTFCSANHFNFRCPRLSAMKVHERRSLVQQSNLCFNCLRTGHRVKECPLEKYCKTCDKKHHSLLHVEVEKPDKESSSQPSNTKESDRQQPSQAQNFHVQDAACARDDSILATAVIKVKTAQETALQVRALLDGGSTVSCISEACMARLGLARKKVQTEVVGLGATQLGRARGLTQVHFKPFFEDTTSERFCVNAYVLKKITCQLPLRKYDTSNWPHLRKLRLADPEFNIPGDIDVLLGADVFFKLLLNGKRTKDAFSPDAINSKLGWLVSGPTSIDQPRVHLHHTLTLEETLNQFWAIEQVPKTQVMTPEEKACEEDFLKFHYRDPAGRFVVRIPMKEPTIPLGSSREIALRRFYQIERKIDARPELKALYEGFMEQYEELGHMSKILPENQKKSARVYIPHHYVMKDWNQTCKFRVVFDASSKTTSGFSFNDAQLVGPVVQDSLYAIVMRFRIHRIAFVADIMKMYRQILVVPEQRNLQCILWRSTPKAPVQEFQLNTVTYGTASAPFLATRVLQELGDTGLHEHPLGAAIIKRDFYMDDVMSGGQTATQTKIAIYQIRSLCDGAGFRLSKFASNDPDCLTEVPPELQDSKNILAMDDDALVKTLGLYWDTRKDQFLFKVQPAPCQLPLTKRTLLSEISKIFDPMGWLAPIIIRTKILMQDVWKEKIDWDAETSVGVQTLWADFKNSIINIQDLRIDRWMHSLPEISVLELHGFSDASEKAYAGVVYLRSVDQAGNVHISLLTAKTRVAPANKAISIPRMELCGALLLADLMETVQESLNLNFNQVKAWTDSTIVLCWLSSCPRRWKTFVANRVSRIQEIIPVSHWHHVPGLENPADAASRGVSVPELLNHKLWWKGPLWLSSREPWPTPSISDSKTNATAIEEEEKIVIMTTRIIVDNDIFTRFSTLLRLRRITAWILRFKHNGLNNYRKRQDPNFKAVILSGPLTSMELENALLTLVKIVQAYMFPEEIESLRQSNPLPKRSKLLCLHPVLDSIGVLRVGGRLKHADLDTATKRPILLPRHHKFTEMVIQEAHTQNLHAGTQMVQSILSLKYWIIRGRDAVRHQIRKCAVCTRYRAATANQMMGDLPRARVQYCRAFARTGVDYAGPFYLRPITPRSKTSYKAYLSLFVCFVTKALHLEIVSSQTTEAFLAALRRFTSRRGKPSDIYSDCGTTFVGAAKELKEFMKLIQSNPHNAAVADHLSAQGITWHFNPAGAPHFGGLWEAGVKSVKYHLHRVIGNTRLTYEEFSTVVTQIEGCLNSRPLTPLSSDPTDLNVLTPGHFLIGESLQAIPDPDLSHLPMNRLNRWQLLQKLKQDVHKRWLREYVTRLQQRPKWMKPQRNIEVGDMVLVKSDVTSPGNWPLARVIEIFPGQDGYTRVVTLRTTKGEIKRPIVKLCLLPFDHEDEP